MERLEDPLDATALPSLLTSAFMIATAWRFTWLGDLPLTKLAFFMLLPMLSALACLQDKRFLATFKRLFHWVIMRLGDPPEEVQSSSVDALQAARDELFRSMNDRWPSKAMRNSSLSRFPQGMTSETSVLSSSMNGAGTHNNTSSSSSSSNGKSLYDQVRSQLKDHVFPSTLDAPIYFMDPHTGSFLRVNEQHKLVFTSTPDASCLFHVVKGKTHHWGFHSTIHQLYLGQNLIGKVVVNAKKMHSWESFRVLERPDKDSSADAGRAPKTIYLVLCSARFGKGMWLGRHRRTPSNPADTYLTKNFTNALALVYASDLSAFELLSQRRSSVSDRGSLVSSGPVEQLLLPTLSTPLASSSDLFGDRFQTPVLASAERARVVLPWIEDVTSKRFFELSDRQMIEVVSTTISRMTVREFIDFFIDQDARRMCHEKTSQAPAPPRNASIDTSVASAAVALPSEERWSEWHLHPHFGFVRKLSYRPPASTPSDSDDGAASVASLAASIAIDQFHSCSVDETTMHKAVFRSKMYTLSIPNSNGFSIETVFEFHDTHDRDGGTGSSTAMLQFKCRTGVHFTRTTMFSPQIERGVRAGVKATCDLLLRLANDYRQAQEAVAQASSVEGESGLVARKPREMFPPQTLAIEVINGMVNAVRGRTMSSSDSTPSRSRSSLIIEMPWTPAALPSESSATAVSCPRVSGFFESAPEAFECVVEETLRGHGVTPSMVFDSLLSDECSFFHVGHKDSGTMDVDIGAWRVARFPVRGDDNTVSYVRKELFSMPVSGVPGTDIARVENYQYYALQRGGHDERLEFGMKLFAKELPDGDKFSIEVLVVVDKPTATESTQCELRVSYAIAKTPCDATTTREGNEEEEDPLHAAVAHGTARGLRFVWKRIALVIGAAAHRVARSVSASASGDDIRQRLQLEGQLPSHDELAAKVIESIAALY